MTRRFDHQFQVEMVTIHPGEYYATQNEEVIATILGSCVSVVLWDEERKVGGLNHFMLAVTNQDSSTIEGNVARFGEYAMEMLINDLMKMGSTRKSLVAKVFGGGSVLKNSHGGENKIPQDNISFALDYLRNEGIPVIAQDVGGTLPRKIYFFPKTNKVLLKRITQQVEQVAQEETTYLEKAKEKVSSTKTGDIVWFS